MATKLGKYNEKRQFEETPEPRGRARSSQEGNSFVVQKHDASRLHYDFRLEHDGVMWSWAVPKGPSLSPKDKRLAVHVEDHPLDYRDFEGTIPKGQYGAGEVIVWDRGTWIPKGDADEGMKKGRLEFDLEGQKLHGGFILVRTPKNWLLIKRHDEHANDDAEQPIVEAMPGSVLTDRTLEDIVAGGDEKLPKFGSVAPMLATLVKEVPKGDYVYEIKYDGYRTLGWLKNGKVQLASRRGLDWTSKYGAIADALSRVRAKEAIFDGEIAYVREDGKSDFGGLQAALGSGDDSRLVYIIFDLLHKDGEDLRDKPLGYRKDLLRTILAGEDLPLRMSDDVEDGEAFFREACKLGLEGIIGKKVESTYQSKRTLDWVKVKCQNRQELVIVGFTPPRGHRKGLGAILVGLREGKKLRYAGKVGTGFSHAVAEELAKKLEKRIVDEPPVVDAPKVARAHWVKPELVAEVRFTEFTKDGHLRHPVFVGERSDKPAKEVARERPLPIKVTHPERVILEDFTKLDLVRYMNEVAERMLPFVAKRPLMLVRCPAGAPKSCFVQKHSGQGLPKTLLSTARGDGAELLYVTNAKQLVQLAQYNCMEVHGWGARLPKWDRPDWIVFDLDPDEALPFSFVVERAFEVREALRSLGLESWVKTTGGKGLHVVVPIERRYDWPTVKGASHLIAKLMSEAAPEHYTATISKRARKGKVFIDYLRNGQGATAVLPWSARARPGMTIAAPVSWEDLKAIDPHDFTIKNVPDTDAWKDLLSTKQKLNQRLLTGVG